MMNIKHLLYSREGIHNNLSKSNIIIHILQITKQSFRELDLTNTHASTKW